MSETGRSGERTVLAWQRTALAVVAGSLVSARISYERSAVLALVTLLLALPLAGWVLVEARALRRQGVGLEAALLCGAVVVLGAVELTGQAVG
jgi:uncharacterized membrane protein YidH (DUF202 family)